MTLQRIDEIIHDRVIIFGSLPPEGGDLDLLARPAEFDIICEALKGAGFVPVRRAFVRFGAGVCEMVELTLAASWGLPPCELAALFAEAQPLAGTHQLARPSQHHALLIQARKVARRKALSDKLRSRTAAIVAEAPDVWRRARAHAAAWRAGHAVSLLRAAYEGDGHTSKVARWRALAEQLGAPGRRPLEAQLRALWMLLPHPRLPRVITFSGLDGSGKSSQAALLCSALQAAGQDATVIWAGIGANRSLIWIKQPVKRFLQALPRVGPFAEVVSQVTPKTAGGLGAPLAEPGKRDRRHGFWLNAITQVWMAIVALANVYTTRCVLLRSLGHERIVIFDRYTLDSAVRLRHWYGDGLATRLVIGIIHRAAKRPFKSYFLDVPPQVAFDRKPEWEITDLDCRAALYQDQYARLGVCRLDGTQPRDELAAEIATDVWRALR
jgi:thymidylate kinase